MPRKGGWDSRAGAQASQKFLPLWEATPTLMGDVYCDDGGGGHTDDDGGDDGDDGDDVHQQRADPDSSSAL